MSQRSLRQPFLLQGSEPSYLERAEQLHVVMCSTMEKVGRAMEKGGWGGLEWDC